MSRANAPVPAALAGDAAWREQALGQLLQAVHDEPWAHDFFALIRRIDTLRPQQPRTGEALRPLQEALRLGQAPELDFAPASLAALQAKADGTHRLLVRFFGLMGPHGPMPLHFTEYVRERLHHHGDPAAAHFLDLFHHRLLSLFYRAWAQGQPAVHRDRPQADRYLAWLGSATGLPGQAGSLGATTLAHQAGLISQRSQHPERLCKVLRQHFRVPVQVVPHVGHWLSMDQQDHSRLGFARNRAERALAPRAELGRSANAGTRVWDRQYRFRLCLGPLTRAQHDAFLPGGSAWRELKDWMSVLVGVEMRWELQLTLRADAKPAPQLGRAGRVDGVGGQGVRLGVSTWLGRRPAAAANTATKAAAEPQALRIRPETSFLLRRT
ncbi:MAG: type VI secretion system baseplate subunit TssG [Burkholderiales bacterium]|nr:type VI secretion system baseplate subunit TssG [Burkholderiales bacterium]